MNADLNLNMRNDDNASCVDVGSPKLRAMSFALLGIVAPAVAQGTAATPEYVPETVVQVPADLQALKDAVFNLGKQHGRVGELVRGNSERILSTEVVTAEQRGRQQQIGAGIAASSAATDALNIRATSLGATAGLAVELSQLRAIAPTSFSYGWYLTKYPDVAATGAQLEEKTNRIKSCDENFILAARHYLQHGRAEGRAPNPLFFPAYYCEHYPDVAKSCPAGVALYEWATEHWGSVGAAEGRQGSPMLGAKYYLDQNPDLRKIIGNDYLLATTHFVHRGLSELRAGSPEVEALIGAKFHGLTAEGRREMASMSSLDPVAIGEFLGGLGDLIDYPDSCADALEDNLTCLKGGFVGCVIDWVQASQVCMKEDLQKAMEQEATLKELKEMVDKMEKEGGTDGYNQEIDKQNAAGERHEREAKGGRMIA